MAREIIRVCGAIPVNDQYWSEAASVGYDGVTKINPSFDQDSGVVWFEVYKGDQLWKRLNARFMEVVEYKLEEVGNDAQANP
ncbi:hypothetical protein GCM10007094_23170 [Pseudovibrio japonicus]|uniref:Uncharacterized protein n=1 Tax=Pseudovibrio japonicus TaxID=366534 RepID=A0ABQ3EIS1_9HYPH|nr:hypothetical protein [Pseudovibrio japonicus]GHB33715.1 hypothetical protein GCM10007094_23170 [Pseudovibrio japonicus]